MNKMDMLQFLLNLLLPPLTISFLIFFYPFYLLIKLVSCLLKHLHVENVAGKVVLITGASSGIGEHVAYEYAKKGAHLALVARRKDRLELVAETSRQLGSGNVIIIPGDVAKMLRLRTARSSSTRRFIISENASKAALLRFFETLRVEISPDIKITIAIPGFVSTDLTTPQFLKMYGSDFILSESVSECAKAIFRGIGRGETYIAEPSWTKWLFLMKNLCPEIADHVTNYIFVRYGKPYLKRD